MGYVPRIKTFRINGYYLYCPAINFYEKIGFKIEGIKRESVYMDGLYHDELYMAKLLEGQMSEVIEYLVTLKGLTNI